MGEHLPLRLRPHPPQGDRAARLRQDVLHLRRRRPEAADGAGRQHLDLDAKRFPAGALLHWVSNHKNELRDEEAAAEEARTKLDETYAAAYALYQRRLREANALDFDDLIMLTVHLFQEHPDVLETYRRRFRHVLVDEYQDTNHAQYALIHLLCAADLEDRRATARGWSRPS